ncbi:endonuclease MutS2 [uncultured Ruminococcus sp.]|uniref:endonuclease MutS2 n=1 Tax=uncultured Ruminococcus sp. TaxID=165186 RepID=UPI0026200B74|nr:endonuclease MutS2 [uncultured Ruminococcus sp.]
MNQHYQILEFHKILDMLANLSANDITREKVRAITPTSDLAEARAEMEKTSDALGLSIQFGAPPFHAFQDMRMGLRRAKSGARLSLKDLLEIATVLRQVQSLSDWYDRCAGVESSLDDLFTQLAPVPFLLEKLDRSILSEEEIADAASPALAEIRRKIGRSRQKLRDTLDNMMRRQEIQECLQDNRVTLRDGRFVLPVRAEHRGKIPGLVHDTSATGQTLFIEPIAVVDANNDIRLLEIQETEEIERIIEELCTECGTWADAIIRDHEVCAELNLYFAKARLAEQMHAFAPTLTDDGVIILKKARHPLIPYKKAVPISFTLGDPYRALIITGPNTGGKTVALKTCGLLTLMAMSGMLIPAAEGSQISVFDHVLADIGDTQSIEQNLSTFSAHMSSVIRILEQADEHSLVLLDELGSGTDPVEGAALAEAIIARLKDNGAKLMVSTHYQELKLYATQQPDVENASCEFDIETLRPTYRLILGSPGKSNAFAISEGLGMAKEIITQAETLVSEENTRFEQAVAKLEETRKELEHDRDALRLSLQQAEENEAKLREELERTQKDRENIMEQARLEAMRIVETTKAQSNEMLTELEQLRKEKEKASFAEDVIGAKGHVKRGFRKMYETANPVTDTADEDYVLPRELQVGDTVLMADTKQKAVVAGKPDKNGMVFLQMGAMRTKAPVGKLRLVAGVEEKQKSQQKQRSSAGRVSAQAARRGTMELDIRGCTCDEGVYQMDAFLDRAVMSHIATVTIIHGKGTGQLRKAIHQRLKQLKYVKSFRLGTFGEGEDGVTIVSLE